MHWTRRVASTIAVVRYLCLSGRGHTSRPDKCRPPHLMHNPKIRSCREEWWRHAVIYEIYPRSFQDSDGDGIGDIKGITSRLDYLHDLGIDAIWITPMYPSPGIDYGYDISDYTAIDPVYGTMADFDNLVAEAKEARHPRHHGLRDQPHLGPAQVVPRVPLLARQSQARLVHLARWQRRNRDRQRRAAQQLAVVVWPLRMAMG